MRSSLSRFISPESMRRAAAFKTRPSDVFVATYPKCGTTWMQQIVHGLRTGGSMDFDEISEVVPWLESAFDLGIDPDAQAYTPRAYKTHASWDHVPKGARYIYIVRDPTDVLVSFYHFFEGWMFESGAIPLEVFADAFFFQGSNSGRYWDHVRSWWPRRNDPNCLFLSFERMKRDLGGVVERVASFIGADPACIGIATEQASFEFMSTHGRKFDDHIQRDARDPMCGLPPGASTSKLRTGRTGDATRALTPALHARFEAKWRDEMQSALGFEGYSALEATL